MKATLDDTGRIELPHSVQSQLGVKAGDEVVLENHAGQWVIRAAGPDGLVLEGQCPGPRGGLSAAGGPSPEPNSGSAHRTAERRTCAMKVLLDTATLVAAMLPDHVHHGHAFPWLAEARRERSSTLRPVTVWPKSSRFLPAFRGLHVSVRPMPGNCWRRT